jgi:hypothetical protein
MMLNGARNGIRTRDLVLTKDVLYLLSHPGISYAMVNLALSHCEAGLSEGA